MNEVSFHTDDVGFQWENDTLVFQWIVRICELEQVSLSSLSYVFCSDEKLLEINKTYLNHDYYTDVITFDLSDGDELDGEVYISIDRVSENAQTFNSDKETELCRVMAHGLLHLMGYSDHTPEEISLMRSKETFCLSLLPEVPRGTIGE